MNTRLWLIVCLCIFLGTGCKRGSAPKGGESSAGGGFEAGPLPGEPVDRDNLVKLPSGLRYVEIQEGIGETPKDGQIVAVRFRGYLLDGTEFDSSYKQGRAVRFILNEDAKVMPAWVEGVRTMKPGGKRKLLIPPALGFGEGGRPPIVPKLTPIVVDLELLRAFTRKPAQARRPAGKRPPSSPNPSNARKRPAPTKSAPTTQPAGAK